ncbi:hypothetical protein M9435_002145 [Picochlorum sp. BPE23]|nr:hypothetical protein M9435_002145 [Picochlorum sp. BPE23]
MKSSSSPVKGAGTTAFLSHVSSHARCLAFITSSLVITLIVLYFKAVDGNFPKKTEFVVKLVHKVGVLDHGPRATNPMRPVVRPNGYHSPSSAMKVDTYPSIIIAGVPKGGTTDLFHKLPDLGLGIVRGQRKELGFFNRAEDSWHDYRMSLLNGHQSGAGVYTIDGTPSYFMSPSAPERIAKYSKDSKIILLLRDPYERALSHYAYWRRKGKFLTSEPDFNEFCMAFKLKVEEAEEIFSKAHEEASKGHIHKDTYTQVYNVFKRRKWVVFSAGLYRYALLNFFNFVDPKNVMIAGSEMLRDRVPAFEQIVSFLVDDPNFDFSGKQVEILQGNKERKSKNPKPTVSATCQEFLQGFYRHHNDNLLSLLQKFENQGTLVYGMNDSEWVRMPSPDGNTSHPDGGAMYMSADQY